ncbi:MAG: Gfo/Idh/MocA family oxidoreductase, partial [bacterium]
MAPRKVGVGIIGSGRIGRMRAHLAAGDPRVSFLALSDSDGERAKRIAEEVGADFHSADNEAVLSHPDVEAVIVSTPEHAHAEPVCRALELGKTVLVEKPLELSLERADRIIEAVRKYNGDLHVGYTQRLRRRYINAKEQIGRGRLGKLLTARMVLYNPMSNGREIYRRSPGASPVTDTLTYVVDIGLWYFEGRRPVRVYAQGGSKIFPHPNNVGDWA